MYYVLCWLMFRVVVTIVFTASSNVVFDSFFLPAQVLEGAGAWLSPSQPAHGTDLQELLASFFLLSSSILCKSIALNLMPTLSLTLTLLLTISPMTCAIRMGRK